MTLATRRHWLCHFYLAGVCHFYLAPTIRQFDNISYVKSIHALRHIRGSLAANMPLFQKPPANASRTSGAIV